MMGGFSSGQMAGALRDGLGQLSQDQEVRFRAYKRIVLPLDGFAFWQPTGDHVFSGSLHYSQAIVQNESEILGQAEIQFTSESQIAHFRDAINTIYVANYGNFRYAFYAQTGFYEQAGLWHYIGHSIPPALTTQLLDTPGMIDPTQAVTTNSLALWLNLNEYVSPLSDGYSNTLSLYPSFLTPPNLVPPYASVHIDPENGTRPLQALPNLRRSRSSHQLMADRVRITTYGLQNNAAIDFLNCVLAYSEFTDNFGIMSPPRILDGKRVQVELEAIAMQKIYEFEVSYYQSRVDTVSRKLIEKAQIAISFADLIPPSTSDIVFGESKFGEGTFSPSTSGIVFGESKFGEGTF
jgi:hypothetical protein